MKSKKPEFFCPGAIAYGYSHAEYRNSIYTRQFPKFSWLEVRDLALPEFLIEIELEVHKYY